MSAFLSNTKKGNEDLLDWVVYRVVTGTVTQDPHDTMSRVFGDALVSKDSSQGYSDFEDHRLDFASTRASVDSSRAQERFPVIREFPGIQHTMLQCSQEVYLQIKDWILQAPDLPLDFQKDDRGSTEARNIDAKSGENDATTVKQPNNFQQWKGVVSLVQDAVDAGATEVEGVQTELTDEVYFLLGKVKPIAPVVHALRTIQSSVTASIYGSIRGVNYGA